MTRINATISPKKLCDQHLIAEYREILRVFKLAKTIEKPPKEFTLGIGHVTFFFDKLMYAHKRFDSLRSEIFDRGFRPKMEFDSTVLKSKTSLYNDWEGTDKANELVTLRILQRAEAMKGIRYRGKLVTFEEYKKYFVEL